MANKKDSTDIWMPLYIGDYLAATGRLTAAQHGAYLLLIMDYWMNGSIPDDDSILSGISKMPMNEWVDNRPILEKFFSVTQGSWVHSRVEKEKEIANKNKKTRVEKAKKGANARWSNKDKNTPSNAPSMPQAMPEGMLESMLERCPLPSPLPLPLPITLTTYSVDESTGEILATEPIKEEKILTVWDIAIPALVDQGSKEPAARSFVGKLIKDYSQDAVAQAFASAGLKRFSKIADLRGYVVGILKEQAAKPKHDKFNGFENIDYEYGQNSF